MIQRSEKDDTLAIMRSNGVGSSLLSERAVEPEYVYMYSF
jgi:hypothetical protein